MRHSGDGPRRVIEASTNDAGQHWGKPQNTALSNPDAAISGVALSDGRMLVALNDIEEGRSALSLAVSTHGGTNWKTIYQLEDQRGKPTGLSSYLQAVGESALATDASIDDATAYAKSAQRNKCTDQNCAFEFSYPYLIQAKNGDLHLVYTWNRSFIKHVRFNRAWLDRRMDKNDDSTFH